MNNQTLEENFSDFIFKLYSKRPHEMPESQLRDIKMAFMAGVVLTNEIYLRTTELPDGEGFVLLDKLQNEIQQYSDFLTESLK